MKLVILAGGYGTRINDENSLIPKPLIAIGYKPIIWIKISEILMQNYYN